MISWYYFMDKLNNIKNMFFKKKTDKKGVSIYLALVILVIFMAISFGLGTVLLSQIKRSHQAGYADRAWNAANTGIEAILYLDDMCHDSSFCNNHGTICNLSCTGVQDGYTTSSTLSDGSHYIADITKNCGYFIAYSTGTYQEKYSQVEYQGGSSLAGPHLNQASGKSCAEICQDYGCICEGISTSTNPVVINNQYATGGAPFCSFPHCLSGPVCPTCQYKIGDCDTIMTALSGPCGPGTDREYRCCLNCDNTNGSTTSWSYCYCTSTSP